MMIAVAVAMAVIIFVWSQGFLSQTSSAAGGQQSQQNIAAQSSVSIDSATFTATNCGTTACTATIIVRNVGAVAETLGSLLIQGTPSNTGFQQSAICTSISGSSASCSGDGTSAVIITSGSLSKSSAAVLTFTFGTGSNQYPASGDIMTIKVATTAGTFATQQFTVP